MIEKPEVINLYLDWYESLLTKKQLEIMIYYYQEDLSYREIAELLEISHSAVYDTVQKATKRLVDYEKELKAVSTERKLQKLIASLKELNKEEINRIINTIMKEENHD
ncbi:MAG: signal recognition particle [Erysipelothrix sp.]|nr:signal recognition particle [Erysipelothrix sp.]